MENPNCRATGSVAVSNGKQSACLATDQARIMEHTVKSWDDAELFYRAWIPATKTDKALLLFHRGHEHSGRWQETVYLLGLDDVAV